LTKGLEGRRNQGRLKQAAFLLWAVGCEIGGHGFRNQQYSGTGSEDLHAAQNVIPKLYSSFFVTPAARLNAFPETAVSPWISFAGGFGHFSESSTLEFGGPNPGNTGTTTGVLQAGLGLDVKIYKHFSLRGEGREFWSGVPQLNVNTGKSHQYNLFAGGGIVWHF
jgi:hypothetical protein